MKHVCENFGRVLICIQKGKLKKKDTVITAKMTRKEKRHGRVWGHISENHERS